MRVTKAMKEFAIKQMDEARMAANRAARADYEARRDACEEEIKAFLKRTVNPEILVILAKYNMSSSVREYGDLRPAEEVVLKLFDSNIRNTEEMNALRDAESARYKTQEKMIEDFVLECDLGCDKEQFFKLIEDMKSKMATL